MIDWFLKLRISAALDEDRTVSKPAPQRISGRADLTSFAESLSALQRELQKKPVVPAPPASLHSSIMRAVRRIADTPVRSNSERAAISSMLHASPFDNTAADRNVRASSDRGTVGLHPSWWSIKRRWATVGAVVVFCVSVLWLGLLQRRSVHESSSPQTLAAAHDALEMGAEFTRDIPSKMIAPLDLELELLHQDLDQTAETLLATLPASLD
jgi:hypothetical protein